ncbi:MAG: uracil-DNA glycosylase [Planctomycetes bacterium]|nr:uracil-DNA glycosylase [Planctomycetota bacterium]
MLTWQPLNDQIVDCDRCPRLRKHCTDIAKKKRRAFKDSNYWGKPVPNFGDPRASLLIVGLAPAAHGANRAGRMFTGDRSGDWLFRALFKAGFSNQPESEHERDRLRLTNCAITAACHCAPPGNKPQPDEMENCRSWFEETVTVVPARVFLALGQIAWKTVVRFAREHHWYEGRMPKFQHAAQFPLSENRWLLGSYHPSQQNTFTGKLTEPMFNDVFTMANQLLL